MLLALRIPQRGHIFGPAGVMKRAVSAWVVGAHRDGSGRRVETPLKLCAREQAMASLNRKTTAGTHDAGKAASASTSAVGVERECV